MAGLISTILLFCIPVAAIVFFIISLVRYLDGRKTGCDDSEMRKRKLLLILSAVIVGVLVVAVVALIVLLYMAIAYM